MAFAVAQSAEGGIGREAIEPSGEGSVAAKGGGLLVESQEHFLRDLFRLGFVAKLVLGLT